MKNIPPVVFYGYEASPASAKLENVLALKCIPHYRVEVAMTLPRPEITDTLGIAYRRIPILSIGNDVYCDTSLIIPALERRFPPSLGFPTLFPQRKDGAKADTGMIKAFAAFYADRPLFTLGSNALPYNKFPPEMIADRSKFNGAPMDVEKAVARQPVVRSLLGSHATLLEEQLSDGREWVFDTVSVGCGDLALYCVYGWIVRFRGMKEVFNDKKFPKTFAWLGRMVEFEKTRRASIAHAITKIDGAAASKIIADNINTHFLEVDFDDDEGRLLGLKLGDKVQVIPDDNARNYPTIGKLIGLTREEIVLQLSGTGVPSLRCHFPRLNFSVNPATGATSKL
ncbi:uncharacterized protein FOMMEDRAFT_110715 [Fomitiporia mediterranea MF3/22]|uniref:uncharacterized protein n=1 Tax=Fomitiporia mediterranea (strain MF3/22) TaxID=694068 RepID=UPI00044076D8|nr:uncharacterized protein FOMMEDRAFT_110715 [Fomitiporia mediterranea MF3/22]EJD01143.1 hypothetical protein FOMMEDRAFT_110715 [Fomitiporia mediterranea MF3/22]